MKLQTFSSPKWCPLILWGGCWHFVNMKAAREYKHSFLPALLCLHKDHHRVPIRDPQIVNLMRGCLGFCCLFTTECIACLRRDIDGAHFQSLAVYQFLLQIENEAGAKIFNIILNPMHQNYIKLTQQLHSWLIFITICFVPSLWNAIWLSIWMLCALHDVNVKPILSLTKTTQVCVGRKSEMALCLKYDSVIVKLR